MLQSEKTRFAVMPSWLLPVAAGLVVVIAAVFLAYSLRQREHHHVQHMTDIATAAVKADIEADLDSRFLSPVRTTNLWNPAPGVRKETWRDNARVFLSEHPSIFAVAQVMPDGRVWSIPEGFAANLSAGLAKTPVDSQFPPARDPYFSTSFTDGTGERFRRVILPLANAPGGVAYGVAAFRERESVEDLLGDVSNLGYVFIVSEGDQEIFRHSRAAAVPVSGPRAQADVAVSGIRWNLRVWPGASVLGDLRSLLSVFVLLMGTLLALLVALAMYFAQSVRRKNVTLTAEIAERQRYESALQSSEARLNGILDTSVDGVVAVDEDQNITLFNKGAENIFGYRADEVMGKPLSLLIPQRFQQPHRDHVHEFGATGKQRPRRMAGPREVFGLKKDGTEFPIEASISKVSTAEGLVYTSIIRDVTDRVRAREELERAHQQLEQRVLARTTELAQANEWLRREIADRQQAEEKLRTSEQRLQAILDNCTACVFMKDTEGRYLLINRWYETLFGLKNDETLGKSDFDIFPANVAAELRENDQLVLRSQHPIEFEENVAHPDGSIHTYIATKFLVRDATNQPFAICGIATDITRQKQAEELLSELSGGLMAMQDEERKRLARDLHEGTAQMLAALQMNLELAKRMAREDNQKVASAIDVSLELVEQSASELRTMAYLLHPPGLDDFGLTPALRWYADGFSSRSGIKVNVDIDTTDSRFDRNIELAVFRIVQEALTNIVRHSNSKTAEIVLRQSGAELELEVSDSGHGIAGEIMNRMSSGKTVPGIGLAGIRERVRQLGGIFGIHSGPEGVRLIAKLPTSKVRESKSATAGVVTN